MRMFVELLRNGSPESSLPTVPGDHGTVIGGSISFIGKKCGQRFLNAYDFWMDYLDKLPD